MDNKFTNNFLVRLEDLPYNAAKLFQRNQGKIDLFFANPYMLEEIKTIRDKYGIPDENGFGRDGVAANIWEDEMMWQYPEPFEEIPELVKDAQKEWENLPDEERKDDEEPQKMWSPECVVNAKKFHDDLKPIFDKYNKKITIDNYYAFEFYTIYGTVPTMVFEDGNFHYVLNSEKLFGSASSIWTEKQMSTEYEPAFSHFIVGQPSISVEEVKEAVVKLSINVKAETTIENIKAIWSDVELFQKRMKGYASRVIKHRKLMRDIELWRLVKKERKTYLQAMELWNKDKDVKDCVTDLRAVELAVQRIDETFKPDI